MREIETLEDVATALTAHRALNIGVDGADGVGKTTLAHALAQRLEIPLYSLDSYVEKNQGGFIDHMRYQKLHDDVASHSGFIVEGVCLLQVLTKAEIAVDALVYVKRYHLGYWSEERELDLAEPLEPFLEKYRHMAACLTGDKRGELGLTEEIIRYHHEYKPHRSAQIVFRRNDG